ncbi:MAG: hypothetical protein HC801_07780, partial [Nitrospira sp.]|nr:hypothetical protein [Nitrospira sp.]
MPRGLVRPSLAEILVGEGILNKQIVDEVLRRLDGVSVTLGQTLVTEGLLSEEQLAQA